MRRQARFYGLLVVTLTLIGVFGSLLAYIGNHSPGEGEWALPAAPTPSAQESQAPAAPVLPASNPDARPKPKYDFYQLLPERQLNVGEEPRPGAAAQPPARPRPASGQRDPAGPAARTQTAAAQRNPPPPEPADAAPAAATPSQSATGNYVVQVGSFRNMTDADRLKASIAFLGLNAYIETHTEPGGAAMHRVRIGPVSGARQVEQLRQRLQQNNIQSIAVKTR
jgi:cell division protein FtsN